MILELNAKFHVSFLIVIYHTQSPESHIFSSIGKKKTSISHSMIVNSLTLKWSILNTGHYRLNRNMCLTTILYLTGLFFLVYKKK